MIAVEKHSNKYDFQGFSETIISTLSFSRKNGKVLFAIPSAVARIAWLNMRSIKALKAFRTAMDTFDPEQDHTEYLGKLYERIKVIRDGYIALFQIVSEIPWLCLLKHGTKNILVEWDDLAEDCSFGADPEFRELIIRFAEKAQHIAHGQKIFGH